MHNVVGQKVISTSVSGSEVAGTAGGVRPRRSSSPVDLVGLTPNEISVRKSSYTGKYKF